MVEGTALEMRQTGNGLESSNLSLSAVKKKLPTGSFFFDVLGGRARCGSLCDEVFISQCTVSHDGFMETV